MKKKIKKIIPYLYHASILVALIWLFLNGYETISFILTWTGLLITHSSNQINHNTAKICLETLKNHTKTHENLMKDYCEQVKYSHELRNMNDRLHAVNQAVVQGRK